MGKVINFSEGAFRIQSAEAAVILEKGSFQEIKQVIRPILLNERSSMEKFIFSEELDKIRLWQKSILADDASSMVIARRWNGLVVAYIFDWTKFYREVDISDYVTLDMFLRWNGVTEEDLWTASLHGLSAMGTTVLQKRISCGVEGMIIRTKNKMEYPDYGASAILLESVQKHVFKAIGGSYYMLPATSGFVFAVAKDRFQQELLENVMDDLAPAEQQRLSDKPLLYSQNGFFL